MAGDTTHLFLPDLGDVESRPFWDGCAVGELRVQTCATCGKWRMPPRPMCPHCRSTAQHWIATSGRANVWSFIVPHPPLLPGYTDLAPYNVIVVELEQDRTIRFVGNLVSAPGAPINSVAPDSIIIGAQVHAVFETIDDVTLPRWMRG